MTSLGSADTTNLNTPPLSSCGPIMAELVNPDELQLGTLSDFSLMDDDTPFPRATLILCMYILGIVHMCIHTYICNRR